jgi:catalase
MLLKHEISLCGILRCTLAIRNQSNYLTMVRETYRYKKSKTKNEKSRWYFLQERSIWSRLDKNEEKNIMETIWDTASELSLQKNTFLKHNIWSKIYAISIELLKKQNHLYGTPPPR